MSSRGTPWSNRPQNRATGSRPRPAASPEPQSARPDRTPTRISPQLATETLNPASPNVGGPTQQGDSPHQRREEQHADPPTQPEPRQAVPPTANAAPRALIPDDVRQQLLAGRSSPPHQPGSAPLVANLTTPPLIPGDIGERLRATQSRPPTAPRDELAPQSANHAAPLLIPGDIRQQLGANQAQSAPQRGIDTRQGPVSDAAAPFSAPTVAPPLISGDIGAHLRRNPPRPQTQPATGTVVKVGIVTAALLLVAAGAFLAGRYQASPAAPAIARSTATVDAATTESAGANDGLTIGEVTAIDGETLTVQGILGNTTTVHTTPDTRVLMLSKSLLSDVAVGDMIVIHGDKEPDDSITANLIVGTQLTLFE